MMSIRRVVPYLLMLLVGALGALLVVVALHLWQDHGVLHELVNLEIARQRAAQSAGGGAR